ncbi:MAG: hypothetical protein DMG57_13470 [Acidobacteria bacterium]|nr:MAG: hypothetical protein DMG57_13470 [Acidobacteriota bacterium]
MRFRSSIVATTFALFVLVSVQAVRAESKPVTVKGWVLDSACAFTKDIKKPVSAECAKACAKAGSPLVILADNGSLYWPTSDAMPATGQNEKLLPFAGERVVVHGRLYERGGSKALLIENIEAAK